MLTVPKASVGSLTGDTCPRRAGTTCKLRRFTRVVKNGGQLRELWLIKPIFN